LFSWLALALVVLVACSQSPPTEPAEELTGTLSLAATGSYAATVTWTDRYQCTACGSLDRGCYSNNDLGAKSFTDSSPAGAVVTGVTVVLSGGYSTTALGTTINGTAIGASQSPANDETCGACTTATFSLTNPAGIPGWIDQGSNTLAITVGSGDACVTSAAITVTYATGAPSKTSLASNTNPSVFGQGITFTATVSPASGSGTPSGSVTFTDGTAALGTVPLNSSGQALLSTSTLSVASHTITAAYGGDSSYQTSLQSLSQVVGKASTLTSLATSSNPSIVGASVTLTATVAATAPGAGTPAGSVTFLDGTTSLGTSALNGSGVAALALSALAVGTHSLSASYAGSPSYVSSASNTVSQAVEEDATTVAVTASSSSSSYGTPVTFSATVASVSTGGTPTGSVTFSDGANTLGTVNLNGAGAATFTTSILAVGAHTIGAAYGGDADHEPAAGSVMHAVTLGTPVATLSSAANPSVFGEPVQLTVTVNGATGALAPTGTIAFLDGATSLGSQTVNGAGQATITVATLNVGAHSLTASYAGDPNYEAITSPPMTQTVNQAKTATSVVSSGNPSVVGAAITLSAQVSPVSPGAGKPTGTVTFFDGGHSLGTGTVGAGGVATFVTSSLAIGAHSITASYGGDGNFAASTSGALGQTVSTDAVTVALASSLNPSTYGGAVAFTATVTTDSSGGTPTGTVTFNDGASLLGTGTLNGSGGATLNTSALATGTHAITAVYGGDADHAGGSSSALSQVVKQASTTTAAGSSANPSVYGQAVVLTATVAPATTGPVGPSGSVSFFDGTTLLGTAAVSGGVATLSTSSLIVGTHTVVAAYGGDANYAGSASTALSQVVSKAKTAATVSSSSNPSLLGAAVTLTAAVTAVAPGGGTPTSVVTFYDGTTSLGIATLSSSGAATLAIASLSLGSHSITVSYGGDANFLSSTSPVFAQEIAVNAATIALVASPSPSEYGTTVTLTVTVSGPVGTPSGTIVFVNGATALGSVKLNSSAAAVLTTSNLPAGNLTLAANYGGDADYAMGSATTMLVVAQATTTTTLASSVNPAPEGDTVQFTATITAPASGASGTVEFLDGTSSLGSAPVSGGAASLSTALLSLGGHSVTAAYSGDTNFLASTSAALVETISAAEIADASAPDAAAGAAGDSGAGAGDGGAADASGPSGSRDGGGVFADAAAGGMGSSADAGGGPAPFSEDAGTTTPPLDGGPGLVVPPPVIGDDGGTLVSEDGGGNGLTGAAGSSGGCGCAVVAPRDGAPAGSAMALIGAAVLAARRRRRRSLPLRGC
jgi:MYXO-CTERM domain-containing protein